MISIYTGTPGSGKTLHAAADIRYALTKPRGADQPVIANFAVNTTEVTRPGAFVYVDNQDLTPDFLTRYADDFWSGTDRPFSEDYLLLVIDECSILFNARSWMSKGRAGRNDSRMDWLEFMSQHRKYGYRIILIAQSSKMIDNQFRMLIDDEVNHRKVDGMGMVGAFLGTALRHRLFMRVHYLYQTHERLGMRLYFARRSHMAMYDSYVRLQKVTA